MEIIKKNSKDFSINFIHLNAYVKSKYKNADPNRFLWIYSITGELEIEYEMNGYRGVYQISPDVLADLRPIAGLDTIWKASQSRCICIGFMSANTQDCYEAEVLSIPEKNKEFVFDKETIAMILSNNVYLNDKEIAHESIFRIPANRTVKLRSLDDNGSILVFYKNDE